MGVPLASWHTGLAAELDLTLTETSSGEKKGAEKYSNVLLSSSDLKLVAQLCCVLPGSDSFLQ